MLDHFSAPQLFRTSLRATISGLASSLVLISLIGSVLGRQLVLQRHGVNPSLLTILAGYERVVQVLLGGALAMIGGLYLFEGKYLSAITAGLPLVPMSLAIIVAALLVFFHAISVQERRLIRGLLRWRELMRFTEVLAITLGVQGLMTSTYVLAFLALGTDASPLQLLAGAAVVSFAASLPISVNGWGVRELASIAVFGQLGASPHEAVAASVLVGLCSTVAVLAATPYALFGKFDRTQGALDSEGAMRFARKQTQTSPGISDREMNRILAILCGLGAAILLFFQIRLEISGNAVTVNLADPIALSALAAIAAYFLFQHRLPMTLPRPVWLWLGGITLVLLLGFLNGVLQFGVTPWALSNRLFGWLVILGYVACGALVTSQFGAHGRRVLTGTLVVSAAAVICISMFSDLVASAGFSMRLYLDGLSGYSGNRNTFALQLMLVLTVFLAYLPIWRRVGSIWGLFGICAVMLVGLWQTGSKLGLGVTLILLLCAALGRRRMVIAIVVSIVIALAGYSTLSFIPAIPLEFGWWFDIEPQLKNIIVRSVEPLHAGAFDERLTSLRLGWDLWLSSPIFGSGLGAAIRQNLGFNGAPLVIHSTPIWILAEFGLVGFAVVLSLPCYLLWQTRAKLWRAIRRRCLSPYHMGLLGICLVFGLFGLGHEIAYQRLFWLLIGAFAAQVITSGPADDRQTPPPA